jgi:hypothetical protein
VPFGLGSGPSLLLMALDLHYDAVLGVRLWGATGSPDGGEMLEAGPQSKLLVPPPCRFLRFSIPVPPEAKLHRRFCG